MRPSFYGKNYSALSPWAQPTTYGPNFDFSVLNHRVIGDSLDFSSSKLFGAQDNSIFKSIYEADLGSNFYTPSLESSSKIISKSMYPDLDEVIANTIPGNTSTTESITVGTSITGTVDFNGDTDWYRVSLQAGVTYRINLSSDTLPDGNTLLALYNAAGNLISFDFDGGPGRASRLTFTANVTGDFFVEARAGYSNVTGDYDLAVKTTTVDSIANGIDSNPVIQVDGPAAKGTLSYVSDQDWYAVNLVAGETYRFTLLADNNAADPLEDPFLFLHAPNGAAIAYNDDISDSNVNSRLEYTAPISGTFYLNAGAYTGTNAFAKGDYKLVAKNISSDGGGGGGGGTPSDPLDALNWGDSSTPSNNITVYFATAGEVFDGVTSEGWTNRRINEAMAALDHFTDYIDVTFTRVMSPVDATFKLLTDSLGGSVLGYFYPPDQGSLAGIGVFGSDGFGWSNAGLKQGGYGWITLIHEFGHGLGLAHPHDTGGGSTVFDGVSNSGDRGDFDLNQGVYTTMSYLDGWQLAPWGQVTGQGYGYQGTVMAFDIALLQQKYGANTTHNKGHTTYDLPTMNQSGTFWSSIWDTGGKRDVIDGSDATTSVVIDLRPATLMDEEGGGGFLSYMYGIWGGFTIANGVEIERAYGGGYDDTLIGNDLDNLILGRGGKDTIDGKGGNDTIRGGGLGDIIKGGTGADKLFGDGGANRFEFDPGDSLLGSEDRIYDFNLGDTIAPGAHTFVGEGPFTASGSTEIKYKELSNNRIRIDIDRDGDGSRDEAIFLQNQNPGDDLVSDGTEITLSPAPPKIYTETETTPVDDFVRPDISDFLPYDEWAYIA